MPRIEIEETDEITIEETVKSPTTRPTICLNMIVKNESKIIKDKLEKLCKKVRFDYWVISDTGSTDNTKTIIQDFFQELGIPGELFEDPWKDFGYNRTKAINEAFQKTDYLFIFDADDEIIGDFKLPSDFGKYDSYHVYFGSETFKYLRLPIVNNRKRWRYVGVLHEVISEVDKGQTSSTIEGSYYFDSGRSSSRNENPNKYYDDAQVLEKAFIDELNDPNGDKGLAHRYAFYCAQSYKDAGNKYNDNAIEWYKKVLTLDNWGQEKFMACFTLGNLYKSNGDSENACHYWIKSIDYDHERLEGIASLMEEYRHQGCNLLVNALYHKYRGYKRDFENKLFLYKDKYNDLMEYQNCVCAFYVNDHETGYECCKKIIMNRLLNLTQMKSAFSNMDFYKEPFENDTDTLPLFYKMQELMFDLKKANQSNDNSFFKMWTTLFNKNRHHFIKYPEQSIIENIKNQENQGNNEKPQIVLSFTTCKRLDLFKQTINSILNQWTDYNLIDYWFCVDDNSSEEDKDEMKLLYPWINYYFKTKEEKGHRESMNIIWNKLSELKPTYWIHMEDDFLFHDKMDYIKTAINGLKQLSTLNVKQILFNVNYSETIESYNTKGDIAINGLSDYSLHVHKQGTYNYMNNHYWPHYSFRPSLIDVETILSLGNFNSDNQFFEMDYANKWTDAGFKSCFFNKITCRHIGRLTSEREDLSQKNAYHLNDESQFYDGEILKRKGNQNPGLPFKIQDMDNFLNEPSKNVPIKIVNLLRREDRKIQMVNKLEDQFFDEDDYEFISAVDGSILEVTQQIIHLFKGNDFGSRRGFIGCALTHLNLWKHLVNDDKNDYYLIIEDDSDICEDFKERIRIIEDKCLECPILILGYHMFSSERNKVEHLYNNTNNSKIEEQNIGFLERNLYIGGTFCYSINKKGAQQMIDYIEKNGIKHGIDYLIKINTDIDCYEIRPQLAFSDWNEGGKQVDTDIQGSYDALDFTDKYLKDKLESEFIFVRGKDQMNNDIYGRKSFDECIELVANDNSCVAFNSLGFIKSKITGLTSSPYFGVNDGIYIKKAIYDKYMESMNKKLEKLESIPPKHKEGTTRIKLICDWCSSEQLCNSWKRICDDEENYCWKDMQITWEDKNIDYYVIINRPIFGINEYYDPKRTIIFQMEPWVYDTAKPWGVKTWDKWAKPDKSEFMHINDHKNNLNNVEWHINLPLVELEKEIIEPKLDRVSAICSSKSYDEGHMLRNNFIKYIDEQECGIMDVYGKFNYHNFECYKGPLKDDNKYNGISQYKYHFSCENNEEDGYATEKIWDALLCESLCFYWGCPNLEQYIDPLAFVRLDLNNQEESLKIVKQAIEEDWWSQRIQIIRREKTKVIEELGFFPNLKKIIASKKNI
jgi:GR25 family glycosyltransferase involved in LPS biosynthesis